VLPIEDAEQILFQLPGAGDDHNHKGNKNMKKKSQHHKIDSGDILFSPKNLHFLVLLPLQVDG